MVMKKIYSLIASAALSLWLMSGAMAQINVGGVTMNNDIVGWGDLYNLSFTAQNYGTARSMAMGNAFTALGADMVSASLNPAGIGMYVNSDFSFTPVINFARAKTPGTDAFNSSEFQNKKSRLAMSSIGGVGTVYRGSGALTNFNLGFAYNRIADFNQSYKFAQLGNEAVNSLANLFCEQSNADGLTTGADGKMNWGNDPYYWGAILAYKNGLTNKDDQGWFIDRIGIDSAVDQFTAVETIGGIGEYAFTMGFNFVDKFYLGATLGIQSVDYQRSVYYGENYNYPNGYPSGDEMPYQLEYMNYLQATRLSGTGVNFKVGFTWRPVAWLRIGAAYHTRTAYNLSLSYYGDMWSSTFSAGNNPDGYDLDSRGYTSDYVQTPEWEDAGSYSWRVSSPSRLMAGVALTIAQRLILSADYEAAFYDDMWLRRSPIKNLDYTATIHEMFRHSNTIRLGAEFRVLPCLDLRAGYIYSGDAIKDESQLYTHPLIASQRYITAGIGIRFSETTYLDLAYQYNNTCHTAYQSFYATGYGISIESAPVSTEIVKHVAVLTLGLRF